MHRHSVGMAVIAGVLGGCSPSLQGSWFGRLACGELRFDTRLELEGAVDGVVDGLGTQLREFEDSQRNNWITAETVDFDVRLRLPEDPEVEALDATLTCTAESTIEYKTNKSTPTTFDMDCEPDRFEGYTVSWDRLDTIQIAGPDTCSGALTRTSD